MKMNKHSIHISGKGKNACERASSKKENYCRRKERKRERGGKIGKERVRERGIEKER